MRLWNRAKSGDTEAFGALYERHVRAVLSFCLWRTGDLESAEDAMATAFLEAWRNRERLELTTESATPLLLGIATNVLRHHWRSSRRHRNALSRLRELRTDLDEDGESEAIERVEARRQIRQVGAEIRSLPRREREVLALVAWGELSYEETATALRIPVGTVRSRISRARARLGVDVMVPTVSSTPSEECG